jgi:hypothetical protein
LLAAQVGRQAERWTLWTPVTFGCAAAIYFALLREPQSWVALVGVALAGALLLGWTLSAAFLGLLWLCLWKGPLGWLGLPLALAVNLVPSAGAD